MRLAILLFACAVGLAACVESAEPILTDAKPVFGSHLKEQFYRLNNGRADDSGQSDELTWSGKGYVSSNAKPNESVTFYPFGSGDFIVEIVTSSQHGVDYALLHKLTDGVFLSTAIDEDDADEATRKQHCAMIDKFTCSIKQGCIIKDIHACRIKTREQLEIFAKATAAKNHQSGALIILLADEPTKK